LNLRVYRRIYRTELADCAMIMTIKLQIAQKTPQISRTKH